MSVANSKRKSIVIVQRAVQSRKHAKNAALYKTIPADPYSPPIVRVDGVAYRHQNGRLVPRVKH